MSTLKEQIYQRLESFGITEQIDIEDEAAEMILNALTSDDLAEVFIDEDGALIVEFNE
jgi:Trk K+ transport system NAD-binding subunit